jgi:CRP-like cAMP-binding protein
LTFGSKTIKLGLSCLLHLQQKLKKAELKGSVWSKCPLFSDIAEADRPALLKCLGGTRKCFKKNGFVFKTGGKAEALGVVLSGAVQVLRQDYWGNRLLVDRVEPGGVFSEAFSCLGGGLLPVSVQTLEDSEILLINCRKIFTTCSPACAFHATMTRNLALILAEKAVVLTRRLTHVTQPSTREKLLSFLSEQARLAGGNSFDIPFSRQELADYLAVDRSAMSGVISKLKADKLLSCRRNHFELLSNR